jgi:molybdopterin-guanine dinucleotide biosynthesis protein B
MKIFGLVGRSGSGKTSLMVRLLPEIKRRGLTVSTIKHAHHGFDLDHPGKDSFRHREAGAKEVMLVADARWALMHEIGEAREPPLEELVREGFHTHGHPVIEVYRPHEGHALIWRPRSTIVAVASDAELPNVTVPVFDLNDAEAIATFALANAETIL